MISLTRKHLSKPTISDSFLGRTYTNYNKENYQTILNNQNWETFYKCGNPSQAWSILSNIILSVIDNICPQKMFNIKKITDPWITDEILEVLLLNKAKRTKTDDDWTAAKLARNEANLLIRNSKADFIKENLEIHKNDSKTFWENINTILPQKNN